jgi:hypothetical protein
VVAELYIREHGREGRWVKIWPGEASLPLGMIQEARTYIFEGRDVSDPAAAELYIDELPLEALRTSDGSTARWRWSPGFHAGAVEVLLDLGPRDRHRFDLTTDPDLKKLTRTDFDNMVREILEDTYSLFSLSAFRTGIARGTGRDVPPLSRLEFLRSRIDEIEKVVRTIDRQPVRILKAGEETIPYWKARSITSGEILRSFRSGRILTETSSPGRLPENLKGRFPAKLRKNLKSAGLNIREHQDIKASLKAWASWMIAVADRLGTIRPDDADILTAQRQWAKRCRALAARLHNLLKLPLFDEVSDRHAKVVATSIYRRVPPYGKFFRLYSDMNLGLAGILGDFLQMPLARTFDLYELWCFLRLLRAAVNRCGVEPSEIGKLLSYSDQSRSVTFSREAVTVSVPGGYSLSFKRTYREFWIEPDRRGSFSRSMIPDISVSTAAPEELLGKVIVLDAKYRIGEQLNDAVASIHMYRDALVEPQEDGGVRQIVLAAYLISPHEPTFSGSWQTSPMPGRLFHPEYRSSFRFGAVTLRPGMSMSEVERTLDTILDDAGAVPLK